MNNPIWKTSYAFDTTTISKCTAEDVKTRPVFQHANYYLSNNKPKDALELYTKILGEISPGHPVAFLNRSLCYLLLDFPSLAVIDAYRAFITTCYKYDECMEPLTIAQILTQTSSSPFNVDIAQPGLTKVILGASLATLSLKQRRPEAVENKKRLKTRRYIWSSITRETVGEGARYIQDKEPLRSIVEDLRMKAYYRIALGLFKCGGGATKSALGIIHNAREEEFKTEDDSADLSVLEDLICQQMEELYTTERDLGKAAITRDSKSNGHGKQVKTAGSCSSEDSDLSTSHGKVDVQYLLEHRGVAAMMVSQQTMIPREVYPWDTFSLSEDASERYKDVLSVEIRKDTENAGAFLTKRSQRQAPAVVLRGNQDITAGTPVLDDNTPFFVTTGQNVPGEGGLICDVCGTLMLINHEIPSPTSVEAVKTNSAPSNSSASSTEKRRTSSMTLVGTGSPAQQLHSAELRGSVQPKNPCLEGSAKISDDETLERSTAIMIPIEDMSSPEYHPPTPILPVAASFSSPEHLQDTTFPRNSLEYTSCLTCQSIYFCSSGCHVLSNELQHRKTCELEIDPAQLIDHNLQCPEFPGIPEVKERKLQSLMLLRLLTFFSQETNCPLSAGWVRWKLDGKLDIPKKIPEGESCWSIGKTPKRTYRLFPHLKLDYDEQPSARFIKNRDSNNENAPSLIHWSFQSNVVFPLLALREIGDLAMALDINRFDGWILNTLIAKIDGSMIVTKHTRRYKQYHGRQQTHSGIYNDHHIDDTRLHNNIWVGSLHFTPSLIPIANEAAGEIPNVTIIEHGRSLTAVAGTGATLMLKYESLTSSSASEFTDAPSAGQSPLSRDTRIATPKQDSSTVAALSPPPVVIRDGDRLFRGPQIDRVPPIGEPSSQSFLDNVETELFLEDSESDDVMYSCESEEDVGVGLGSGPMELD